MSTTLFVPLTASVRSIQLSLPLSESAILNQQLCPRRLRLRAPVAPAGKNLPAVTVASNDVHGEKKNESAEPARKMFNVMKSVAFATCLGVVLQNASPTMSMMPSWMSAAIVESPAQALTQDQQVVFEAWALIKRAYVDSSYNKQNWENVIKDALKDPIANKQDAYDRISRMLASLGDPFTRFLSPEAFANLQVSSSGEVSGVGLRLKESKEGSSDGLEILDAVPGSPAATAGIKTGDRLVFIDGQDVSGLSSVAVVDKIRGPVGSEISLVVYPAGSTAPKTFTMKRQNVELRPVSYELRTEGAVKVGYIKLTEFNQNAAKEMGEAIQDLEKKGAALYLLDMRNNPGGIVAQGIDIARDFIDDGTIVYTVSRSGKLDSYDASGSALTQKPLAILVNENTASASEILAAAIQDNCRGIIVGSTTFGKGLIQSVFPLPDGSGVAVTTAKYETPRQKDINKLGVAPDLSESEFKADPAVVASYLDQCTPAGY